MCTLLDDELTALGIPGTENVTARPSVAARVAAESGVGELVLTLFQSARLQSPAGQEEANAAARRVCAGPVRAASDLLAL